MSVYCEGVGCHVLCLRHGLPVWQHIGQSTTARSRQCREMTSDFLKATLDPTNKPIFLESSPYFFPICFLKTKGRVVCGTVYGEMHLKDLLGSFVRVGYRILVPDFYLVLHGLCCRKSTIMD